jgi:hypothetical protein
MRALIAIAVLSAELYGVTMPDSVMVDGKALKLNGMGLRTKAFFKVYVAGLYLESPTTDADKILSADGVRRIDLQMKRDLGKEKMNSAIHDGIERNNKDKMAALAPKLERLSYAVPDLKEGQTFSITYVPGKGTSVVGGTGNPIVIEGKDFADAIFSCWLGKNPVDEDLKKGLLGGK